MNSWKFHRSLVQQYKMQRCTFNDENFCYSKSSIEWKVFKNFFLWGKESQNIPLLYTIDDDVSKSERFWVCIALVNGGKLWELTKSNNIEKERKTQYKKIREFASAVFSSIFNIFPIVGIYTCSHSWRKGFSSLWSSL